MKKELTTNKKVGIVTLYGNLNFGNKLQNFAVQELFHEKGFLVETIICKKKSWKTLEIFMKRRLSFRKYRRERKLSSFSKSYLSTKILWRKKGVLVQDDAKEYDFLAVGSDQVWNPMIRVSERDNFLLRFAERNQRICVSPSLGVDEIPNKYLYEYTVGLNGFPYLCCREKSGADIIEKITGRKCEHLLDPTLVIPADKWRDYEEKVDLKGKPYIMMFFLGAIPEEAKLLANKLKAEADAEIIMPSEISDKYYAISPFQFIYLIDNATYVLTDSFHGMAFSINLNTRFYVFDRAAKNLKEKQSEKMSSRILSLAKSTNLCSRYVSSADFCVNEICDFTFANHYLEMERDKFHKYLDKCLHQKELATLTLPENECTGCGSCVLSCPTNSIKMESNIEGFLYPVIDYEKCINCKKCTMACPVINPILNVSKKNIYAAYNRDFLQLEKSSSGAIFPALAEYIISVGGAVVGAYYNSVENTVKHKIIETIADLDSLRTSKYVQSNILEILCDTKKLLEEGRWVLFTGTPCQIAGLKSYLKREFSTLVTCDCSCHGVPSPGLWTRWIKCFQKKYNHDVESVCFRDQSQSEDWGHFQISYQTNSEKLCFTQKEDAFFKAFSSNISLRLSCFECKYKGWNRCSDITLADFWGVDKVCPDEKNERGTSMILVHTEIGENLLKKISPKISLRLVDNKLAETVNRATWKSVSQPEQRRAFFEDLQYKEITECIDKYAVKQKPKLLHRIRHRVVRLLGGL